MKRSALILICFTLVAALFQSCQKDPDKKPEEGFDHVLILYSAGCNDLSSNLTGDIMDLLEAGESLPKKHTGKEMLIVSQKKNGTKATSPYIVRARRTSAKGYLICDTLKVLDAGVQLADPGVMSSVLGFIKEKYPSGKYGMIFSSHASGWLPKGYYGNSSRASATNGKKITLERTLPVREFPMTGTVPYYEIDYPDGILTKSVGRGELPGGQEVYEMTLQEFAGAIPMDLDYLIFDACFMGGIETAYELKDKVRYIAGSQTEIMADGMVYKSIVQRILNEYDLEAVCRDFYEQYASRSGTNQSATISLIRTDGLESLASTCAVLFEKYRYQMGRVSTSATQRYYRGNEHWFYDLEDIMVQSGITASDLAELRAALEKCVIYTAHTDYFMNSIHLRTDCGFSMYLPKDGNAELNSFYRNFQWNKATGLVE